MSDNLADVEIFASGDARIESISVDYEGCYEGKGWPAVAAVQASQEFNQP